MSAVLITGCAAGAVAEEPAEPDFAWLSRHSWEWDPVRLDELIRAAAPTTLYLCSGADNQLELADRCPDTRIACTPSGRFSRGQ
jgi:hypothetical protein